MNKILKSALLLCLLSVIQKGFTQNLSNGDSAIKKKTAVANSNYENAGKTKRILLGRHYRKEWATPVEVAVLDMDAVAGGLTPLRLGGGKQTKSLRLKGSDGKEYVLRSVNKDPSKTLPPELVGTFANDVVQDQISSSNPYAPLVVARLAEAAGILHTNPQIVYVPASERLGEYKKEFANTMCLFEERPSGDHEDNPGSGFADNVLNSQKMLEKVFSDPDHTVDAKAFLKARLFDMWIGDWDRHEDQWLWAGYKVEGKTIYKPIPRDRDQAFASLDGIIPQIAARPWFIRRTQNFDFKIRDIIGLNMGGIYLDRNFTTELTLGEWMEITAELQQDMTDEIIKEAFKAMPDTIFSISGKQVIAKLRQRRNELPKYARSYYRFLSKEVDITGTNKKEVFEVSRINDDSTRIMVYSMNKKEEKQAVIYQRYFKSAETKEIRLYGLGGNDKFIVEGNTRNGILVRIIGGGGKDSVLNNATVDGNQHKIKNYTDANDADIISNDVRNYFSNDTLKNQYNRSAFRYNWFAPKMVPGYNPDDGLYIGGGFTFKKQQFGKLPYGYMQTLWFNHALATGAYNFGYEGNFKEVVGRWDLHVQVEVNAPNHVLNYFGLGNETELTTDDKDYNRVRSNQVVFSSSLNKQYGKYHFVNFGLGFQSVRLEETPGRYISNAGPKIDSTDFDKKYFASAKLGYQFNTTDNPLYPRKGVRINSSAEFIHNLAENNINFVRLASDVSWYYSVHAVTAAFRTGVSTNLGDDYEFYQANTLSGTSNLRGYRKSRFAGKTSFYNNAEIRIKLETLKGYILRGNWGLLAFFDNGRVWLPGENSDTWHYSYGGGIWFLPYNKMVLTATYGISKEDQLLNIKAGFMF